MPSIKKNTEQEKALKAMNKVLATIESINAITNNTKDIETATISFTGKEMKKAAKVQMNGDKDITKLLSICSLYKAKLVKEVEVNCTKYGLVLDDEEKGTLYGTGIPEAKSEPVPEAQATPHAEEETMAMLDSLDPEDDLDEGDADISSGNYQMQQPMDTNQSYQTQEAALLAGIYGN